MTIQMQSRGGLTRTDVGRGDASDIASLIARRTPGRCLESPFYASADFFRLDVEAIFARHWIFVAGAMEIPEPGDFITVDFGTTSVIVLRDDDEVVRAFHNVCRHRGSGLLTDVSGSVGNVVCGYHKWTYATDGRFLHAESLPPDFDPGCFGLKQVQVGRIGDLVFICLADDPPADFQEVAATVEPYLAPHSLGRTKVAAQTDIVEDGNWKLVMENNRECYHCDGHPELICSLFQLYGYSECDVTPRLRAAYDRYQAARADLEATCEAAGIPTAVVEELDTWATGFRLGRDPLDGAGESFSRDGRALCQKRLAGAPTARLGDLALHLQPNAWFHFLGDHAVLFSVLPLAADRTRLRTTWLVHEDAIEGVDYNVDDLTAVWRATNEQDRGLVARTQQGVTDPAFEPGPYSPTEYQGDAFLNWYIGRLRSFLG